MWKSERSQLYFYAVTLFTSAFLLFQVQPLMGKYILPWFGGAPSVWTVCLLFFQVTLLVGYSYAYFLTRYASLRWQLLIHGALLGCALLALPITPSERWKLVADSSPTWQVLMLLSVAIGFPYAVLSSTSPLLQSWFGQTRQRMSPYRLYAVSNTGSLLGLLAYPFYVEWAFRLNTQTYIWSALFALFVLLSVHCAWLTWIDRAVGRQPDGDARAPSISEPEPPGPLNRVDVALWIVLSCCGSIMLLASTNHICQDIAAVPFLWVLPLSVYLISFIVCFDRESWYRRYLFAWALILGTLVYAVMAAKLVRLDFLPALITNVIISVWLLAGCCFICHGELVRLKPPKQWLPSFYLAVAAGGALGGLLVSVVAPAVFSSYAEFSIGLIAPLVILLGLIRRDRWRRLADHEKPRFLLTTSVLVVSVIAIVIAAEWFTGSLIGPRVSGELVASSRNFFGALQIVRAEKDHPERDRLVLVHGSTLHGFQYQQAKKRHIPTMYYTHESGVGRAILHHPRYRDGSKPLRMGVVGLGVGTLSCYARKGDYLRYYEIDPKVVQLADQYFTFDEDARQRGVDLEVYLGDARIVMEQQLADGRSEQFDLLVIDAFSSDAIPAHLLTRECFQVYQKHLAPGGVLAIHISNRHIDLSPVVRAAAESLQMQAHPLNYSPG
ncbi:MAG: fused MFS/spermidine synthase, partial [Thermoguttaceae bacterium]